MLSPTTAGHIFHILAAIAFVWLLHMFFRARAVRSWPSVVGTVIESRTELDADRNTFPVVRYRYTVEGRAYVSDRILPHGRLATTGGYAARVVGRYKEGADVRVYVNPRRPGDSALEPRIPTPVFALLLAATVAFWWMGDMFAGGFAQ